MFNQGALGAAAARAGDIGRNTGPPNSAGGGRGWRGRGLISFIAFAALTWRAMLLAADMGLHGGWATFGVLVATVAILWWAVFSAHGLLGYFLGALVAALTAADVSVGWFPDQSHTGGFVHDIPVAVVVFVAVGVDQWLVKRQQTDEKG